MTYPENYFLHFGQVWGFFLVWVFWGV